MSILNPCSAHEYMWKCYKCTQDFPYGDCKIKEKHLHFICCMCGTHKTLMYDELPPAWQESMDLEDNNKKKFDDAFDKIVERHRGAWEELAKK